VFAAANIYNQYETATNGAVGSDWVVNFPTKRFYVDAQPGGEIVGATAPIPPFEHLFGAKDAGNGLGLSCTVVGISIYDREEGTTAGPVSGFSPPPPSQPPSSLCHETNVITFNTTGTNSILDSGLSVNIVPVGAAGWLNLTLTGNLHDFRLATNGNQYHGLPITGFEAVKFTNGNVGGVLANYAGVYRHRQSRSCTNAGAAVGTANGSGNTPPCS